MGKWPRHYHCNHCGYSEGADNPSAWQICPECGERMYDTTHKKQIVVDTPLKGEKKYYKEKWFRRSEKEWHDDIRSRRIDKSGNIIRTKK